VLIKAEDVHAFLSGSLGGENALFQEILVPTRAPDGNGSPPFLTRLEPGKDFFLDGYRSVDPLKILLYNVREQVYPFTASPARRLVAGVKACDLKALAVLDRALVNEDFVDPAYKAWREATTILSADCTDAAATCHCTLVGGKPFPESGFDLNLSRLDDSYEIVTGSDKGRELLERMTQAYPGREADGGTRAAVEENRTRMTERLKAQNAEFERKPEYLRLRQSGREAWVQESKGCVGCGACTNICPTCYCLILNEEGDAGSFVKVRSYDSCQWHGYARVAGGASPRPRMDQRFRNRYLCKFLYMQENFGELGCTGCGRCIEACPGEIDIRSVTHVAMGLRAGEPATAGAPAPADGGGGRT
jgi:sulfhydrogenase subunit beta (sulfur reductase)